jgi:hypothetical protein
MAAPNVGTGTGRAADPVSGLLGAEEHTEFGGVGELAGVDALQGRHGSEEDSAQQAAGERGRQVPAGQQGKRGGRSEDASRGDRAADAEKAGDGPCSRRPASWARTRAPAIAAAAPAVRPPAVMAGTRWASMRSVAATCPAAGGECSGWLWPRHDRRGLDQQQHQP